MSEKFSTDKLAEELETIVTEANASEQFRFSKLNRSIMDAIIARLRAGENLENKSLMKLAADLGVSFSAAKILEDHVRIEYDAKITKADKLCEVANIIIKEIASYDDDDSDEYIICQFKDLIQLRKAIADYEKGDMT